jgi:hypothetical protein
MYGILVVEDGNELYQPIGEVVSVDEARELAEDYERWAGPDNPDSIPPAVFVIWRRDPRTGRYTKRELLEI